MTLEENENWRAIVESLEGAVEAGPFLRDWTNVVRDSLNVGAEASINRGEQEVK